MSFSYSLFLALILLFPGFCAWAGVRAVDRTDLLTPRPDKPNSTATLFVVVLGTMAGHILGAVAFALQALWCRATHACLTVAFDPNVYRALFAAPHAAASTTDGAIAVWFLQLALVGLVAGALMVALARTRLVKERWNAIDFGWLNATVRQVRSGDAVILAYVVSKTSHEGVSLAYEGIVRQMALDDDQIITMLVLEDVDRFLLRIGPDGFTRLAVGHEPIAQMQLHLAEIANVALEVLERRSRDGGG